MGHNGGTSGSFLPLLPGPIYLRLAVDLDWAYNVKCILEEELFE